MFDLVIVGTDRVGVELAKRAVRRNWWVAVVAPEYCPEMKSFRRMGGEVICGRVAFSSRWTLAVQSPEGTTREIRGRRFLLNGESAEIAISADWLAAIDLATDDAARIWCDKSGQTWTSHVFAHGKLAGFPHAVETQRLEKRLFADVVPGSSELAGAC